MGMIWEKVQSSNIKRVGYNQDTKELKVEFHHGGTYKYWPVPKRIFRNLVNAASVGTFFSSEIKGNNSYSWEKLK